MGKKLILHASVWLIVNAIYIVTFKYLNHWEPLLAESQFHRNLMHWVFVVPCIALIIMCVIFCFNFYQFLKKRSGNYNSGSFLQGLVSVIMGIIYLNIWSWSLALGLKVFGVWPILNAYVNTMNGF